MLDWHADQAIRWSLTSKPALYWLSSASKGALRGWGGEGRRGTKWGLAKEEGQAQGRNWLGWGWSTEPVIGPDPNPYSWVLQAQSGCLDLHKFAQCLLAPPCRELHPMPVLCWKPLKPFGPPVPAQRRIGLLETLKAVAGRGGGGEKGEGMGWQEDLALVSKR